jgi:multiple sugar transport system ATP-binding protein
VTARFGEHRLAIPDDVIANRPGPLAREGHVLLGIRPEDLEDAEFAAEALPEATITTTCTLREALGSEVLLHFPVATAATPNAEPAGPIDPVEGASTALVARVHPESRVREGDRLRLVVDTKRLHFFDPESGLAYLP